MNIVLVTPARAGSRAGNRITALRWARWLRTLGHRVRVTTAWHGQPADLMIALHARRSRASIARFHRRHPTRPLVVVLTGTDLYRDIAFDAGARASLEEATLLVTLQDAGRKILPAHLRPKTRVVYQAAPPGKRVAAEQGFPVCVAGHLREEKDPFRCAYALALLPEHSEIRVRHLGRALDATHAGEARRLAREQPRYAWLGEVTPRQVRQVMRESRLLVQSSRMEGGANVIAEALALGLPVLASAVSGNIGMLGTDYAGYFPVGDEGALARLLSRAETDPAFYHLLESQCRRRARLMTPARERRALAQVLREAVRRATGARRTDAGGRPFR